MGKKKSKPFKPYIDIVVEPFRTHCLVLFSDSIEKGLIEFNERFEPKHGLNPIDYSDCDGMVLTIKDIKGLKCYAMILDRDINPKVIVHEAFHLISNIANEKGAYWDKGSDEFYAYALENIFNQIYTFYRENIEPELFVI